MKPIFQHPALERAFGKANGCWLAAALILIATTATPAAESLSVLLQKAIFAEETEGDLEAAIKIYEGIAKESDANRSIAAQAQYRLAVCQQKKGEKKEAAAGFRKLIQQFGDSAELIARSRQRLAELGLPTSAVVTRQIEVNVGREHPDRVSWDGRWLSLIDWDTGDLWLRDLHNTVHRKLTQSGAWTNNSDHVTASAFSPDAKWIAYSWWLETNNCYELRLTPVEGGPMKVLASGANQQFDVHDWSPDGQRIVVALWTRRQYRTADWKGHISLVDMEGNHRDLVSLEFVEPLSIRFSPDGRYLAYSLRQTEPGGRPSTPANGIYVLELRTGVAKCVVDETAKDYFLGWAPQGSQILFNSHRRGTSDLWTLEIKDGGAAGELTLVKADLGDPVPVGVTRDGAFCYRTKAGYDELSVAGVNLDSGAVTAAPRVVMVGQGIQFPNPTPSWSPDGRLIAAFSGGEATLAVSIINAQTGSISKFPLYPAAARALGGAVAMPHWAPDNGSLVFLGRSATGPRGVLRMDAKTGTVTQALADTASHLHHLPEPFGAYDGKKVSAFRRSSNGKPWSFVRKDLETSMETEIPIPQPEGFSPSPSGGHFRLRHDGQSFIYLRSSPSGRTNVSVFHNLQTGQEVELWRSNSHIVARHSPDGKRIALMTRDDHFDATMRLYSLSDEPSLLYEMPWPKETGLLQWTMGSKYLLCVRQTELANSIRAQLWTFSAEKREFKPTQLFWTGVRGAGNPQKMNFGVFASADGKQVSFSQRYDGPTEIWMLENFLPPFASSK